MFIHGSQRGGFKDDPAFLRWVASRADEHQKAIGLVGEMMSLVLLGLGNVRACVVLGREIRPGGRDTGVVFIQVIVKAILRMDHPGRAHGLTKESPGYPGNIGLPEGSGGTGALKRYQEVLLIDFC